MTSRISILLGALACCCAASSFAQTTSDPNAPKTRAQVRQEFLVWYAAGYDPNDWLGYPDNAIRASRIIAQQRDAQAPKRTQ
ncbi:hypothetical protein BVER_05214 [Candidatus Burkholderia verschuerenii]|uniref:DUF4148 domain-containing protein n=1 Tax=Candidatus Burkholderia verschuerenii TaxID=242163 RepID=A0A0L0M7M0_9BURK|nr:DUF4148 domain-containing protein [Candidatus Burkholderia verschuerenii]KND58295.1 hypothetical protein BVER_05214 [Candidatus Burkholderia verschuerenii]